jgi:large subunit ribosomal protein L10
VAELAKEVSSQVKTLKKPAIKGGAVDGVVIGPEQVEDITKLPSREQLIGRVVNLALSPVQRILSLANAPAGNLMSQLKTMSEGTSGEATAEPAAGEEASA